MIFDKEEIERILAWLELDHDLRKSSGRYNIKKAWLTKKMGISGQNQTKGAIAALKFILGENV